MVGYSNTKGVQATYRGEASITKFASIDRRNADDFLNFDSLYFSGMDIGYASLFMSISEVALTDFYSRLIIKADGIANIQESLSSSSITP